MTIKDSIKTDQENERRHLINVHVGSRIRLQRTNKDLSAIDLGRFLHVHYQRIYYYEEGKNQVSSSTLYNISQILDVPVSFFFDGIVSSEAIGLIDYHSSSNELLDTVNIFAVKDIKTIEREVRELAEVFYKIEDKLSRKGIIEFLRVLGRIC